MTKIPERLTQGVEIYDDEGQIPHIEGFKKSGETWLQRNSILVATLGYAALVATAAVVETAVLLRDRDNSQTA